MLVLIVLLAAPPMRALGSPADLDAAQKLTRDVCEAMAHRDFKPLQELIRNGDIRNELIQRMPETYPTDPKKREAIAAGFMKEIENERPQNLGRGGEGRTFHAAAA